MTPPNFQLPKKLAYNYIRTLHVKSKKNHNPEMNMDFGSIALNLLAISDDSVHLTSQTVGKYLID